MKSLKIYVKLSTIVAVVLFVLCITCSSVQVFKGSSLVYVSEKVLPSILIQEEVEEDPLDIELDESQFKEPSKPVETPKPIPTPTPKPVATPKPTETPKPTPPPEASTPVLEQVVGTLSGYGPDCIGCTSNKTASGYYIGDGNIFYRDKEYGNMRIVSGDRKYPFGTIIKLKDCNYFSDDILAIVLDRGGNVGLDKKVQFDLLFESEAVALTLGLKRNVTFEVLRLGY